MDALMMCGGEGSRLAGVDDAGDDDVDGVGTEKPLVRVGGVPMVERVRRALADSRVDRVHAVVSPNAPGTRAWAERTDCAVIEGRGDGYVADLDRALAAVDPPALTVAADLPLLAPAAVDDALDRATDADTAADTRSLAVCVPTALKRALGASVDASFERDGRALAPTGLNVVAGPDATAVSWDARLAVNVNRPADLALARRLCGDGDD